MALLKEQDRAGLRKTFAEMTGRVRLAFFTQALDCETCSIVEQILGEVAPLGEKIELVKYNAVIDREAMDRYGIARVPAIAILRLNENDEGAESKYIEHDYGVRLYGVPSGYEFMSLIGGIMDVSSGDSHLSSASRTLLAQLTEPTHIQVFTTPT